MTPESQRIAIAEAWREIKNYYHLTDSTGQAFVQAAIEKATEHYKQLLNDALRQIASYESNFSKDELVSRAAHASGVDKDRLEHEPK